MLVEQFLVSGSPVRFRSRIIPRLQGPETSSVMVSTAVSIQINMKVTQVRMAIMSELSCIKINLDSCWRGDLVATAVSYLPPRKPADERVKMMMTERWTFFVIYSRKRRDYHSRVKNSHTQRKGP